MLLGPTMDPKVASELSLRLPHLGLRMAEHSRRALAFAERLQLVRARMRHTDRVGRARGRGRARAGPAPAPCTVREGGVDFGGARGVSFSSVDVWRLSSESAGGSPRLRRGLHAKRTVRRRSRASSAGGAPRPHQERRSRCQRSGCAGGAGGRRRGVPGPAEPPAARAAAAPGQPRVRLRRPAHPGAPAAAPRFSASACHASRCLPDGRLRCPALHLAVVQAALRFNAVLSAFLVLLHACWRTLWRPGWLPTGHRGHSCTSLRQSVAPVARPCPHG